MRAVEADDPARNRCGCFLPDLTRLATAPSADFRATIWGNADTGASAALHRRFTGESRASHRMSLVWVFLAVAASPNAPDHGPILVTGHAWAPFISPVGEPFRAHSPTDDTLADWFRQADRNHDGKLSADELDADAERFFRLIDTNHDGEIDPDELVNYEYEIAPDIQLMSETRPLPGERSAKHFNADDSAQGLGHHQIRGRDESREPSGLQGAARYGLINIPEPVASADTDFNRGVSLAEFRAAARRRFQILDDRHSGMLSLEQLELLRSQKLADLRAKPHRDQFDKRVGNGLPAGD